MVEDFSEYNGEGTIHRKAQLRLLDMLIEFDRICKKYDIPYFISGGTCLGAVRHGGFIPWDDDIDIDVLNSDYQRLNEVLHNELYPQFCLQTPKSDKGYYQMFTRIVDKKSTIEYPETNNWARSKLNQKGLFLDIFPIEKVFSYWLKANVDSLYIRTFRLKRKIGGNSFKRIIAILIWPFVKLLVYLLKLLSVFSNNEKMSHSFGTYLTPRLKKSNLFPPKTIAFEGVNLFGPAKPDSYLKDLYGDYMKIPEKDKRIVHAHEINVF